MSNNQLTHNDEYQASKIGKLINQFTCPEQRRRTSSPINLLNRARKYNKNMQNEPNLYHGLPARGSSLSACNITRCVNIRPVGLPENERKNEPKRTQNEPNFSPKLASFYNEIFAFANNLNQYQSAKSVLTSIENPESRILCSCDLCSYAPVLLFSPRPRRPLRLKNQFKILVNRLKIWYNSLRTWNRPARSEILTQKEMKIKGLL
jgi:hypothetical protein